MNLVFPMAGEGTRFVEEGYTVPKPFIKVGGVPLATKAILCYARRGWSRDHYYILKAEHHPYFTQRYRTSGYILENPTRGPLESIMSQPDVVEKIASHRSLLIADCDSLIDYWEFRMILKYFKDQDADGGTPIRHSTNQEYSYARLDEDRVIETREKEVISRWSTTGPYWFKDGLRFLEAAQKTLNKGIYSVCPVYNELIEEGAKIIVHPTNTFEHLGTPKDLEVYAKRNGFTLQRYPADRGMFGINRVANNSGQPRVNTG